MKARQSRMNRTGITLAPELSRKMIEGVSEFPPTSSGDSSTLMTIRAPYIQAAEPVGSIPPPPRGGAKDGLPLILTNKLGERLAFERTGTRLYEAFLGKLISVDVPKSPIEPKDVEHILEEEREHFLMLSQMIEQLGGDPTAVTPAADIVGVMSSGLVQVLTDPRTTVDECLGALLTAELDDNDAWVLLTKLATELGRKELVKEFEEALLSEDEHLMMVRGWVEAAALTQPGVSAKSRSKSAKG